MHPKSGDIKIMRNDEANKVIEELFESLRKRYQTNLKESMKGCEFVFNLKFFQHLDYHGKQP